VFDALVITTRSYCKFFILESVFACIAVIVIKVIVLEVMMMIMMMMMMIMMIIFILNFRSCTVHLGTI
jgi:hypothetical protein